MQWNTRQSQKEMKTLFRDGYETVSKIYFNWKKANCKSSVLKLYIYAHESTEDSGTLGFPQRRNWDHTAPRFLLHHFQIHHHVTHCPCDLALFSFLSLLSPSNPLVQGCWPPSNFLRERGFSYLHPLLTFLHLELPSSPNFPGPSPPIF